METYIIFNFQREPYINNYLSRRKLELYKARK